MWFLPLVACVPSPTVTLAGVTWDGPGGESPSLGDVDVEVLDDEGKHLARTTSDASGAFEVDVPGGFPVFVALRRDGYATTTFPGIVGIDDAVQRVEDHTLYALPLASADQEDARFAGCPGVGDGPAVVGELRIYGATDPNTGEPPIVEGGKAFLDQAGKNGESRTACYLDDDTGAAYDPNAYYTGVSGAFGLFGVEPGVWELEVRVEATAQVHETATYPVYLPDEPLARAPWYPALVEFPL